MTISDPHIALNCETQTKCLEIISTEKSLTFATINGNKKPENVSEQNDYRIERTGDLLISFHFVCIDRTAFSCFRYMSKKWQRWFKCSIKSKGARTHIQIMPNQLQHYCHGAQFVAAADDVAAVADAAARAAMS